MATSSETGTDDKRCQGQCPAAARLDIISSIIEYLKSAGLAEDVVAEELSKQFLNSQGGVDYEASSAQKRWAGKYERLQRHWAR